MLRRNQLCPGAGECPEVLMRDPFADAGAERCEECPLALLDEYLGTAQGRAINQAIDLDYAIQAGVTVSLTDITYPEFWMLRFLREERQRFQAEAQQKAMEGHAR